MKAPSTAKPWVASPKALVFICGADHPTTVALKAAAESGSARDIKAARAAFLKLKSGERKAALAMLGD